MFCPNGINHLASALNAWCDVQETGIYMRAA